VALCGLSAPLHEFRRGVIVYRQAPAGTELSAQESDPPAPVWSPEQAALGVTGVDDPSAYRATVYPPPDSAPSAPRPAIVFCDHDAVIVAPVAVTVGFEPVGIAPAADAPEPELGGPDQYASAGSA